MTGRKASPGRLFPCGVVLALLTSTVAGYGQDMPEGFAQAAAVFAGYEGEWRVTAKQPDADGNLIEAGMGTAVATTRVGGRFLEIETSLVSAPLEDILYVMAFDTRHRSYNIIAFDNSGTYFVTAAGDSTSGPPHIEMYGTDEDPDMRSMGLDKAFAFVWHLGSMNRFFIETLWIDTRTEAREEHLFLHLEFNRETAGN